MNILEWNVKNLMDIHRDGGRPYFDALDAEIRSQCNLILPLVLSVKRNRPIAVQGAFGLVVYNMIATHFVNYQLATPGIIWLKSSPRKDEPAKLVHLFTMPFGKFDRNPVFIDDSCYSGKTIEAMDSVIQAEYGLNVQYSHVIYDGSKAKLKSVYSFFRYYDHY